MKGLIDSITESLSNVQRTEANAGVTGLCAVLCVIYTRLVHCGSLVNYFNPLTHHWYQEVIDLLSFSTHLEGVLHRVLIAMMCCTTVALNILQLIFTQF